MEKDYPYSTLRSWLRQKVADVRYCNWLKENFGDLLSENTDVAFSKPIDDVETVESIDVKFNESSQSNIYRCLTKIQEKFKNVSLGNITFSIEDIGEKENVFARIIIGNHESTVLIKDSSTSIKDKIASIKLSDNFEQIMSSLGKENFVFTIKLNLKSGNSIDIQETISFDNINDPLHKQYWKILSNSGVGYIYNLISKRELEKNSQNHYINNKLLKCDFFKAAIEYDEKKRIYRNLFYDPFNEDEVKLEKAMDLVEFNSDRKRKLNGDWIKKGLIYWQYFNYHGKDTINDANELLAAYEKRTSNSFPANLLEGNDVADSFREKYLTDDLKTVLRSRYTSKPFRKGLLEDITSFLKSCKEIASADLRKEIGHFPDGQEFSNKMKELYKLVSSDKYEVFKFEIENILREDNFFTLLIRKMTDAIEEDSTSRIGTRELKKRWKISLTPYKGDGVEIENFLLKKAFELLNKIIEEKGSKEELLNASSWSNYKWYSSYEKLDDYAQNKFIFINDPRHFPNYKDVCSLIKGYYGFLTIYDGKLILVDGLSDIKDEKDNPKWPALVIRCCGIDTTKNNERLMNIIKPAVPSNNRIAPEQQIMRKEYQPIKNNKNTGANQFIGKITETDKYFFTKKYTNDQAFSKVEVNLTSTHKKQ